MKKIKDVFTSILSQGGISCKRVCAFSGWTVALGCYIYAVINGHETPALGELLSACVVLLGIEPVANIFKKNDNGEGRIDN